MCDDCAHTTLKLPRLGQQIGQLSMNTTLFANGSLHIAAGASADADKLNTILNEITTQLPSNRQHSDLFYAMYIKLLDRLFGEEVASTSNAYLNTGWVKGVPGGWLRALMSISSAGSSAFQSISHRPQQQAGRGSNVNYIDTLPYPIKEILQKFVPLSPVFDMIAKFQGGYEINLKLLPTKLQMFIAEHNAYQVMQSRAHARICLDLLKNPLSTPSQVRK